jgi:hypothetical protein
MLQMAGIVVFVPAQKQMLWVLPHERNEIPYLDNLRNISSCYSKAKVPVLGLRVSISLSVVHSVRERQSYCGAV